MRFYNNNKLEDMKSYSIIPEVKIDFSEFKLKLDEIQNICKNELIDKSIEKYTKEYYYIQEINCLRESLYFMISENKKLESKIKDLQETIKLMI